MHRLQKFRVEISRMSQVGVMIARQDIAEQQRHPHLGQGGHAGVHDPHLSPGSGSSKILPRCAQ